MPATLERVDELKGRTAHVGRSETVTGQKFVRCISAPGGAFKSIEPTAEYLGIINAQFASKPVTAKEIVIREGWAANNKRDRDRERFHEDLLRDFASTLPGRPVMWPSATSSPHMWVLPGKARTFKSWIEGDAGSEMWVRYLFYYRAAGNEEATQHFDDGIWFANSIGFFFTEALSMYDEEGDLLYVELRGPGEAVETSIVGVEAQFDARTKTASEVVLNLGTRKEDRKMSGIKIGTVTYDPESQGADAQKAIYDLERKLIDAEKALESAGADLRTALAKAVAREVETDADAVKAIGELSELATMGSKYRDDLVEETVKLMTLAEMVKAEAVEAERSHLKTLDVDRIKTERDRAKAAFEIKNPDAKPTGILEPTKDAQGVTQEMTAEQAAVAAKAIKEAAGR